MDTNRNPGRRRLTPEQRRAARLRRNRTIYLTDAQAGTLEALDVDLADVVAAGLAWLSGDRPQVASVELRPDGTYQVRYRAREKS